MASEPLFNFTPLALSARFAAIGMTPQLARRLLSTALRRGQWPTDDTTVSSRWLSHVQESLHIPTLQLIDRRTSALDGFQKFLFAAPDGARFESVLIPLTNRPEAPKAVACVSSQSGCPMGCSFCATGRLGLARSLDAWEIVAQVSELRRSARAPLGSVVFMGMGEPLLNYDAVIRAASVLSDPSCLAIAAKSITLSTAGIAPAIRRLADEGHAFRLIVSLTSADSAKRRMVMPVEDTYGLADLRAALDYYHAATRRRITLAWTLISGFNTSDEDARQLADWVGDLPVQLDLIDVNDAAGLLVPPKDDERNAFRDALRRHLRAPVIRRYSGGKDIDAACGMLAARQDAPPQVGV